MSRISFANYVNIALSADYLALTTHFPYGRLDFHSKIAL